MNVAVEFRPARRTAGSVELPPGACVGDLLRACGQPADHTLAVRGGVPVAEDEALRDGDRVLLLSAFSGG